MLNVFLYVIFLNQRLKLVSLKEDSGEEPIILNTVVIIGKKNSFTGNPWPWQESEYITY